MWRNLSRFVIFNRACMKFPTSIRKGRYWSTSSKPSQLDNPVLREQVFNSVTKYFILKWVVNNKSRWLVVIVQMKQYIVNFWSKEINLFLKALLIYLSVSSVTQSCLTLCDPMECSTPGFLVHHQLPELAHTHVHRADGAIQPSHSLSFPSLDFNLSQNQGLF